MHPTMTAAGDLLRGAAASSAPRDGHGACVRMPAESLGRPGRSRLVPPRHHRLLPPAPAIPAYQDRQAKGQQRHPHDQRDDPVRESVDRVEQGAPGDQDKAGQRRREQTAAPQPSRCRARGVMVHLYQSAPDNRPFEIDNVPGALTHWYYLP